MHALPLREGSRESCVIFIWSAADLLRGDYKQSEYGNVRDIMERFRFETRIARLESANLLYLVARKFVEIDPTPTSAAPTAACSGATTASQSRTSPTTRWESSSRS